jgi:hypothetical protein
MIGKFFHSRAENNPFDWSMEVMEILFFKEVGPITDENENLAMGLFVRMTGRQNAN